MIKINLISIGKAIGLPDEFLWSTEGGKGGGICQVCSNLLITEKFSRFKTLSKIFLFETPKIVHNYCLYRLQLQNVYWSHC